MMKEEGNLEWVGREKRRSTLRNFNWFLLVNVLLALYLLLQRAQTFGERSLSSLLRGAPAICGVVLLSALSFVAIRQLATRGKLASWRGAVVCTLLLTLCWCSVFHHLIVSDSINLLYPLTLGLLFSSLIAFYLSPRLFFLFSIPVLLVAIAENIFIHRAFSLVNLISYALMLFLIYSAQSRLEQWFQLAIEREQENKRLIERLRRIEGLLAGLAMPHADSEVAQWVTVSQGVAQWQPGQNREQLLAAADQALYRAKELGRNGYSIAS